MRLITLIFLITLSLTGCISSPLGGMQSEREQTLISSGDYVVIPGIIVPKVDGPAGCGAQALAAALAFEQSALDAQSLANELPWHNQGATPIELLLAARSRGFEATIDRGSWELLVDQVGNRSLTLVMLDASPVVRTLFSRIPTRTVMHWALVSGVATDGSKILFADRNHKHSIVGRDDFFRRWAKSDFCAITISSAKTD